MAMVREQYAEPESFGRLLSTIDAGWRGGAGSDRYRDDPQATAARGAGGVAGAGDGALSRLEHQPRGEPSASGAARRDWPRSGSERSGAGASASRRGADALAL